MIREQLLKEYMDHSHKFKMMTWKACNLDLPDGFITKKGAGSINKAEKAASLIAQAYGIPGEFCDIFNAAFGDNPGKETGEAAGKGIKKRKQISAGFFPTLNRRLMQDDTAFVSNIAALRESKGSGTLETNAKIGAIQEDKEIFQGMIDSIERQEMFSPEEAGKEILAIISEVTGVNGSYSEIRKKIKQFKKAGESDSDISSALVNQSYMICVQTLKANLTRKINREPFSEVADVRREYDQFQSYVSSL